jgi:hypothetical protein
MTGPLNMDGRLGRQFVGYDERNRNFRVRELLPTAVERKPTFWAMPDGPFPLDQKREGGCEAWGLAHELAAGPVMIQGMTNEWAHDYYQRIRATDHSMGNDFPEGATTPANMKTALSEKLITGYRWCFGVDDVADTLVVAGPVCLGIPWTSSMYSTAPDGRVVVSGSEVGGHFITLLAYDVHPAWGPVVGWLNSWGFQYGVSEPRLNVHKGIGWLTLPDLAKLLAADGEAVVPSDYFAGKPAVAPYFAGSMRAVTFHDQHPGIKRVREFQTFDEARAAGLRPCRICRPKP